MLALYLNFGRGGRGRFLAYRRLTFHLLTFRYMPHSSCMLTALLTASQTLFILHSTGV